MAIAQGGCSLCAAGWLVPSPRGVAGPYD